MPKRDLAMRATHLTITRLLPCACADALLTGYPSSNKVDNMFALSPLLVHPLMLHCLSVKGNKTDWLVFHGIQWCDKAAPLLGVIVFAKVTKFLVAYMPAPSIHGVRLYIPNDTTFFALLGLRAEPIAFMTPIALVVVEYFLAAQTILSKV